MIPKFEYSGDFQEAVQIPESATFWLPTEEEIPEDEGIGLFRDVWMILGVPKSDALGLVEVERKCISLLDRLASNQDEYEEIASCFDDGYIHESISREVRDRMIEAFPEMPQEADADECYPDLGGLEVGVSALAYALSFIGAVPAASCRAHIRSDTWADRPVVIAAIDRQRADWLLPLLREAGCGFSLDAFRGEFLSIDAPSIVHSNRLAQLVLDRFPGVGVFDRWLDLSHIYRVDGTTYAEVDDSASAPTGE
ncbi:hypothetical protein [Streptomyces tendae]